MLARATAMVVLMVGLNACTTVPLAPNEVEICQPGSAIPRRITVPPGVDRSDIPRLAPEYGNCL